MSVASFQIHPELARFVGPTLRSGVVERDCARAATLKQAIEACGVPHTEIGRVLVNGAFATLSRIVRDGDVIEVLPHTPGTAPFEEPLAFMADAHLGGVARMLRMLGFDTLFDQTLHDPEIVELAASERRVVLTRDRELLKRRDVHRGCFVHALKPEAQLREIASRYPLASRASPFTLCLHCNVPLEKADPDAVLERVPESIRARYKRFTRCARCRRIYWEGSHWGRMREMLSVSFDLPPPTMG